MLAIVIGDKAEDAFRQAMLMSNGSLGIFFSNALVATIVLLSDPAAAVAACEPVARHVRSRKTIVVE